MVMTKVFDKKTYIKSRELFLQKTQPYDVSIFLIKTEVFPWLFFDGITNSLDSSGKSLEDSLDISTLLHGDDSELIFFIDPDQEGLFIIVEDSSSLRPVPLHTSNSEVSVSGDKEEMIINKLLPKQRMEINSFSLPEKKPTM